MTDRFDDAEPTHAASATAHLLDELQLHGHRPFADEPDPRPLPDPDRLSGAVADIFDALVASLGETRLEPDLPDLLWSLSPPRVRRSSTILATAPLITARPGRWLLRLLPPSRRGRSERGRPQIKAE